MSTTYVDDAIWHPFDDWFSFGVTLDGRHLATVIVGREDGAVQADVEVEAARFEVDRERLVAAGWDALFQVQGPDELVRQLLDTLLARTADCGLVALYSDGTEMAVGYGTANREVARPPERSTWGAGDDGLSDDDPGLVVDAYYDLQSRAGAVWHERAEALLASEEEPDLATRVRANLLRMVASAPPIEIPPGLAEFPRIYEEELLSTERTREILRILETQDWSALLASRQAEMDDSPLWVRLHGGTELLEVAYLAGGPELVYECAVENEMALLRVQRLAERLRSAEPAAAAAVTGLVDRIHGAAMSAGGVWALRVALERDPTSETRLREATVPMILRGFVELDPPRAVHDNVWTRWAVAVLEGRYEAAMDLLMRAKDTDLEPPVPVLVGDQWAQTLALGGVRGARNLLAGLPPDPSPPWPPPDERQRWLWHLVQLRPEHGASTGAAELVAVPPWQRSQQAASADRAVGRNDGAVSAGAASETASRRRQRPVTLRPREGLALPDLSRRRLPRRRRTILPSGWRWRGDGELPDGLIAVFPLERIITSTEATMRRWWVDAPGLFRAWSVDELAAGVYEITRVD